MYKFAKVALISKTREIDNLFTYKIADHQQDIIAVGDKVLVPFGRGNALREAYVFELTHECHYKRIKTIQHVLKDDINLSKKDIELCRWLRTTYLCTYSDGIKSIIPSGTSLKREEFYIFNKSQEKLNRREKKILAYIEEHKKVEFSDLDKRFDLSNIRSYLNTLIEKNLIAKEYEFKSEVKEKFVLAYKNLKDPQAIAKILEETPKTYNRQRTLLNYLLDNDFGKIKEVNASIDVGNSVFRRFEELGIIEIFEVREKRTLEKLTQYEEDQFKMLNYEQQVAYDQLLEGLNSPTFKSYLLHGITGSGKTEIYMHLVNDVLDKGKTCLILVPEISLTPQMIERFTNRFGEAIAILHSKLSLGERFDQWKAIKNNQKKIIIGARSAIFSPADDIDLIIIDEEHENTYKSEMDPKYETKAVAKKILEETDGTLILGSATPSIDSYYQTLTGEIELLELNYRANNTEMPEVEIVDMREELNKGNKKVFSENLNRAIVNTLEKDEQLILFLNRKGHSTFVSCRECGESLDCPNCEISLTYHEYNNSVECSYCGYKMNVPKRCPSCNSTKIKYFGIGTEKLETLVNKEFPQARVARLDSISTRKKGSLQKIINDFQNRKYDILVGTQMVTKGFDFENVTLVGVIAADLSLNFPDFTSPERTFQLVTQVAGRAGRGLKEGTVILQTYSPEHYSIISSSKHNYEDFFKKELQVRKAFDYPPFVELINIIMSSKSNKNVIYDSKRFYESLEKRLQPLDCEIFGPNPALFSRIKGKYRYQIFIKSKKIEYFKIKDIIKEEVDEFKFKDNVYLSIDVKPRNLI